MASINHRARCNLQCPGCRRAGRRCEAAQHNVSGSSIVMRAKAPQPCLHLIRVGAELAINHRVPSSRIEREREREKEAVREGECAEADLKYERSMVRWWWWWAGVNIRA